MSSVTISSLTISSIMNVHGATTGISGEIMQIKFSSSSVTTTVSSSTFQPVANIVSSIALSNPNNYVRISLTGTFATSANGYLTIFRDKTVNLGDPSTGLVIGAGDPPGSGFLGVGGAGVTIIDTPGDTISHSYQAYIATTSSSGGTVYFPWSSTAYLCLEEITH